jgi:hypothetical protein
MKYMVLKLKYWVLLSLLTYLGDIRRFLPYVVRDCLLWANFLKSTYRSSPYFWLLFSTVHNKDSFWLGYVLGRFFSTNTSGHPGPIFTELKKFRCLFFARMRWCYAIVRCPTKTSKYLFPRITVTCTKIKLSRLYCKRNTTHNARLLC